MSLDKYTSVFCRILSVALISLILSSCKVAITAGDGGSVHLGSEVGSLCSPCNIDTADASGEAYVAVADSGFVFDHWEGATGYCTEEEGSICTIEQFGPTGVPLLDDFDMELTAVFIESDEPILTSTPEGSISAGGRHSCALLDTGEVQCFGDNYVKQLGYFSFGGGLKTVSDLSSAIAVIAGGRHSCALLDTGEVQCWGSNNNGQVGYGSQRSPYVVPGPIYVIGIGNATALAAGNNHSCALLDTGEVQCWGRNSNGQLGDGSTTNSLSPVTVSGIGNAIAVTAGYDHSCALLDTSEVQCWGWNSDGQLGDGSTTNSLNPVTVSGISNAIAVTAGQRHSCVVLDAGEVQCWGSNSSGQLGDDSISSAIAVSAGTYHSCALLDVGEIQCWGSNSFGNLGDGNTTSNRDPVTVSGISNAVAVTVGHGHSCARLDTGDVQCWGGNDYGQLGDGSTSNSTIPVTVVVGDL